MIYTGVGSKSTPLEYQEVEVEIARRLAILGWTLRSGAADGSDAAFEEGSNLENGISEIYLPWSGFNKHTSSRSHVSSKALFLASKIHPAWDKCSQGVRKLHGRNMYQVLGSDLSTPSSVTVCWTKNGAEIGGTRSAIVLSRMCSIPIINLGNFKIRDINIDRVIEDIVMYKDHSGRIPSDLFSEYVS